MKIQLWRETLVPYELAVEELLVKFKHIIKEYRQAGQYSPIEGVQGRVKKISSILEKAHRKNIPLDEVTMRMDDLAGIRIICQFVEDIDRVVDIIHNRNDMTIKEEVDYVHNVKPSGYRSYHIIIWYDVETITGTKKIPVEIQIRTMAMDFWATIEHSLRYKYPKELPIVTEQRLAAAARALYVMDGVMSDIRDEVVDAQGYFQKKAALVEDSLNNIQNLHGGDDKNDLAIANIQNEFYDVFYSGNDFELKEFGSTLDKLVEDRGIQKR